MNVNESGAMKAQTKFHGSPPSSCQDVSLWITVLDQQTDEPTKAAISDCMLLAGRNISPILSQDA